MVKNVSANERDTGSNSWVRNIPVEKEMATTLVFLPRKSHGQRSLVGYSPGGHKESDMTEHTLYTRHLKADGKIGKKEGR